LAAPDPAAAETAGGFAAEIIREKVEFGVLDIVRMQFAVRAFASSFLRGGLLVSFVNSIQV
jgi:hypothetical protein